MDRKTTQHDSTDSPPVGSSPTAFVAGASGAVGRALVDRLIGHGARVFAHVRPDSPRRGVSLAAFSHTSARVSSAPWEADALREALHEARPTHVFCVLGGGARHAELCRLLIDACSSLSTAPRFVYLSALRGRHSVEEAIRRSGLPYSLARAAGAHGPALRAALRVWTGATRLLGARQHARRYGPTDAAEVAHGLVHAGFNYTTIDRVLMPEELRYGQANRDEHHVPATRRDGRH